MYRCSRLLVLLLISLNSDPCAAYDLFPGEEPCPKEWILNVDNNRCYFFSTYAVKYPSAKDRCETMSAHLTTDVSKSERNFLKSMLFQKKKDCGPGSKCSDYWIGLHLSTRYWSWPDGTLVTNSNWFPDYPGPDSKCGLISVDAVGVGWKNENCGTTMRFICTAHCPIGFMHDTQAKSCYRIIADKMSWKESVERCNSLFTGARLAIIVSQQEINAVSRYIKDEVRKDKTMCFDFVYHANFWIGGRRQDSAECQGLYRWRTYNESVFMEFTNWKDEEPNCNIAGEMCVYTALAFDNKWKEGYCNSKRCALCELRLSNDLL